MSYCDLYLCKTRAVSLDIVPDASCQSFIRSLKRFISQYSVPKLFISDKAKNFVGQELTKYILNQYLQIGFKSWKPLPGGKGSGKELCSYLNEFCERF